MNLTLRPYQQQAKDKAVNILSRYNLFAFFMEMGLGKSLTVISSFCQIDGNALIIIAPKTVLSQWEPELYNKYGLKDYSFFYWSNNRVKTDKYQKEFLSFLQCKSIKCLMINTEAFSFNPKNPNRYLIDIINRFCKQYKVFCILDESSFIKTHDSQRSVNIADILSVAKYRTILTGTEVTKTVLDLYSQFYFLDNRFWIKQGFKNFWVFRARFATFKDIYTNEGKIIKVVNGSQNIDQLQRIIEPYCVKILKKEVAPELPEKIVCTIYLDMSKEQKRIYAEFKNDLMTTFKDQLITAKNQLVLFNKFKAITGGFIVTENGDELIEDSTPKLEFLLDDIKDTDEQIIIVCDRVKETEIVYEGLKKEYGKEAISLIRGENIKERDEQIERFKGGKVRFLVSSYVGCYGLNLQNTHIIYYYSINSMIEKMQQMDDRIHRIGQKLNCIYKYLMCKHSVDLRAYKLLQDNKEFSAYFNGEINAGDFLKRIEGREEDG